MVLGKKNPNPGSGFSENPEKHFWQEIIKDFLQKPSNFHVKNHHDSIVATMISERLYKFSNILSSEVQGQNPLIAASAARG